MPASHSGTAEAALEVSGSECFYGTMIEQALWHAQCLLANGGKH